MHNGAYLTLEEAVLHHIDPVYCLENYEAKGLSEDLRKTLRKEKEVADRLIKNLDPNLKSMANLKRQEVQDLLAFLHSLTDESALDIKHIILESVPSGLPVVD